MMNISSNAAEVAARFTNRAKMLAHRVQEAAQGAVATKITQTAVRLSSGPFSAAQLRAMGHPYSRANPAPPMDPAIINVQSGVFRSSWHWRKEVTADGVRLVIYNDSPEAAYLESGTTRMIPRPIQARLMQMEGGRWRQAVQNAVGIALK